MVKLCPVSSEKVNEKVVRSNALFTAAILIWVLFWPPLQWLVGLVAADFFIRGFGQSTYSPVAQLSKWLINSLNLAPTPIDLAPKQFAARIGFVLSALAVLFFLVNLQAVAFLIVGIILAFALAEGILGFCVACLIYPYVLRIQEGIRN